MRTITAIFTILALLPDCYHGIEIDGDASTTAAPEIAVDPTTTTTASGSEDAGDAPTTSAGDSSSGAPDGLEHIDRCGRCGCTDWVAQAPSPSLGAELRVDLAPMPDGGVLLAAAGAEMLELRRFDSAGALQWSRSIAGAVSDLHVAAVGDGFYLLAGSFTSTIELAADDPSAQLTSAGGSDGFVAFHSETGGGAPIWQRTVGAPGEQRITDIALTGACDGDELSGCRVHLAGVAVGDLGLIDAAPAGDAADFFVVGLPAVNADASAAWSLRLPSGAVSPPAPSLALAGDADLVLATTVRVMAEPGDIVVSRLGRDGSQQWTRTLAGAGEQSNGPVAVADDGSIRLVGRTRARADLGVGALGQDGHETPFIAGLDAQGEPLWTRALPGWPPDRGGLAVVADGVAVLTGHVADAVDFGGGVLTFGGASDVFVARYDASGAHRCSSLHGGLDIQAGLAVVRAEAHRVHLVARVRGSLAFTPGAWHASDGAEDLMISTLEL